MRNNITRLPKGVVVGMLGHVVPERNGVLVHLLVDLRQCAHLQKKVVAIW